MALWQTLFGKSSISEKSQKWTTLPALKAKSPAMNPICVGESIWISTEWDDGEGGLVEFNCESNAIGHIAKYPNSFKQGMEPSGHSITGSNQHGIALVGGSWGKLVTFNTKTKRFGECLSIHKMGLFTSALMIKGNVHIFRGKDNWHNEYLIYSTKSRKIVEFVCDVNVLQTFGATFLKSDDDSEFYKFGGWNCLTEGLESSFFVGKLKKGDAKKPIIWTKAPHFRLRKLLCNYGYIQYASFIITFGGLTAESLLDDIFILDTQQTRNRGWIQSVIKCPVKSCYVAALDHLQRVHLFTSGNDSNQHFCIALKDIVPEIGTKRRNSTDQHNDEKGNGTSAETAKPDNIGILRAMNESLKDEVERLKKANADLIQKHKGLESNATRLSAENKKLSDEVAVYQEEQKEAQRSDSEQKDRIKALESEQRKLLKEKRESMVEVEALKKTNAERKELHEIKVKEMKEQMVVKEEEQRLLIEDMMAENKRMSDQIAVHKEEQKEAQMKIKLLEDKVKELKMKALDSTKFMEWDCNEIHYWIIGLEGGRFQKYDAVLKDSLSVDEVIGEDLLDVTPLTLKAWGVKDRKDSKGLNKHIQELVAQNHSIYNQSAMVAPKANEGAPTAYM